MSRPVATVTRPRHPLKGHPLAVLGRMHRHGQDELLVVLPDGSKSLVPASWTDLGEGPGEAGGAAMATLGSVADLLAAASFAARLSTNAPGTPEQAARRPPTRRTTVQPAQLSLLANEASPAPPPPLAHLAEAELATALGLLASLIAKASREGASIDD